MLTLIVFGVPTSAAVEALVHGKPAFEPIGKCPEQQQANENTDYLPLAELHSLEPRAQATNAIATASDLTRRKWKRVSPGSIRGPIGITV